MSGRQVVIGTLSPSGTSTVAVTASCPSGKTVISGGHIINWTPAGFNSEPPFVTASYPSTLTTWSVTITRGTLTTAFQAQAYAICATT